MENKKDNSLPIAIITAGLLIALSIYGTGGIKVLSGTSNEASLGATGEEKPIIIKEVDKTDHIIGSIDSKIIIVSYTDIECPFCKRFHYTMKEVMEEYKNSKDVAWVVRQFPLDQLHQNARKEAEATECVASLGGNEKFWLFLDKVMSATQSNDGLDMALLPKFAKEVGVNESEFSLCLNGGKMEGMVQSQLEDGISAGARGTPYSVILTKSGKKLPIDGALPIETIRSAIEMALKLE